MSQLQFRPEAFLFDLDGVIVDSAQAHLDSYRVALRTGGFRFTQGAQELVRAGASRVDVLDALDVPPSHREALLRSKAAAFTSLLEEGAVRLLPGVVPILKELAGHGLPLALVSNSREAQSVVRALHVGWAFETVVGGNDARAKPAPEPYLVAAERLGVPVERCVAVEDTAMGAEAAQAAGAFVVVVGSAGNADHRVASVAELPLERWLSLPRRTRSERDDT